MKRLDQELDCQDRGDVQDGNPADEWKHPLQTVTAYVEAIGRWTRRERADCEEVEAALEGIESALRQARRLLADERRRQLDID